MVSQELLDELKEIMQEDYKVNLKQEDLIEFGNMLVAFFELLSKDVNKQINHEQP